VHPGFLALWECWLQNSTCFNSFCPPFFNFVSFYDYFEFFTSYLSILFHFCARITHVIPASHAASSITVYTTGDTGLFSLQVCKPIFPTGFIHLCINPSQDILQPNLSYPMCVSLLMIDNFLHTVNSWLSSVQVSGIHIYLAEISKKIYHICKVIKKQLPIAHMFTQHMVVLPVTTSSVTHPLPARCH
jgi:hypothetical protein